MLCSFNLPSGYPTIFIRLGGGTSGHRINIYREIKGKSSAGIMAPAIYLYFHYEGSSPRGVGDVAITYMWAASQDPCSCTFELTLNLSFSGYIVVESANGRTCESQLNVSVSVRHYWRSFQPCPLSVCDRSLRQREISNSTSLVQWEPFISLWWIWVSIMTLSELQIQFDKPGCYTCSPVSYLIPYS